MSYLSTEFSLVSNEEIESIPIAIKNISGENKTEAAQLGAIDSFQKCETCQLTSACPGHFGKFHLTQPLFKVAFKKLVENIFKYTCSFCGALQNLELLELIKQIDERNTGITVKDRAAFKKILEATKQSKFKCIAPNCQKQVSPLQYSKNNNFIYNSGTTKGIVLDNRHVFNILQNLPQTFKLLLTPSNAHQIVSPENVFYANSILLPPHNLRTINVYDGQVTSLLTSDLNLIMRRVANNETNAKIQKILDSIDNSRGANPYATNKKLTLDTLTGGHSKESYLRSYINGKRIPETARAVIEPSMNKTGFIEVPSYILNKLRDVVFYNHVTKDYILKSLQNEQAFLTYIKSDHNSENPYMVYDLAQKNGYLTLAPNFGDIFEKRKEEGGFVTICRHPSIWLTNIQSGIIKRSEGFTINIPTTICTSFNADFDGDEMTIYSFKSPCANLEQALIMNSRNLFKNSITSNPMFGLVQDQIPALNKLYRRQNYTYNDALVILGQFGFLLTPGKDNYTGKDILSCVFPKHYTLKGIIENGELILENFTNKLVSANSSKSIFGHLVLFYGQEYGLTILDTMRDIVQNFITHFGFSVKIRDMIPSPKILDILEKIVDQEVDKIDKQTKLLYDDIEQGKVIINSYDDISEFRLKNVAIMKKKLESKLLELLDEYYDEDNNFLEMYRTGYKVNINELLSIMCFSGFKNYGNIEMITPGLNGKTSLFSLPDSINLQDYGFIKSSIAKGLTFEEYATIVKQEAFPQIVNVTTGTSQTGFLGKKMVKMASEFYVNVDRFIQGNRKVIDFNPFFLKIAASDISYVSLVTPPPKEAKWYSELFDSYQNFKRFLKQKTFDNNPITIQNVSFYLDLDSEIMTFYYANLDKSKKVNHSKNLQKILAFVEYIQKKFYFNLNSLLHIAYIFLAYFDPSGFMFSEKDVPTCFTSDFLDSLFYKILLKLTYSLKIGNPFGYEVAHVIQEKFTQQSLSSFHSATKTGSNIKKESSDEFKQLVEFSKRENKEELVSCYSYDLAFLESIKNQFEYISLKSIGQSIKIEFENKEKRMCDFNIEIPLQDLIPIDTFYTMLQRYLENCYLLSTHSVYLKITEKKINAYLRVTFVQTGNYDLLKQYFSASLWDGVHKGKKINTNLRIEKLQKIYELKFFIENLKDLQMVDTERLEYLHMSPKLTYSYGSMPLMKISTVGKAISILDDLNYVYPLKHFFDFRFLSATPQNLKKLNDSSEVMKNANHGNAGSLINAAFNNQTDSCNDVYSSLFVGQPYNLGYKHIKFVLNPNKYDQLKTQQPKHETLDDDEQGFSIL